MKSICCVFLLAIAPSLFAQRLPQTIIPSHYSLYLDPRVAQKTFTGQETIDVRVSTATKEIVLNSLDLEITEAEIKTGGSTQRAAVAYDKLQHEGPLLLILGTGWGLTGELMAGCDARLAPIQAASDYNHLSVRSACAIILDRLYGDHPNYAAS